MPLTSTTPPCSSPPWTGTCTQSTAADDPHNEQQAILGLVCSQVALELGLARVYSLHRARGTTPLKPHTSATRPALPSSQQQAAALTSVLGSVSAHHARPSPASPAATSASLCCCWDDLTTLHHPRSRYKIRGTLCSSCSSHNTRTEPVSFAGSLGAAGSTVVGADGCGCAPVTPLSARLDGDYLLPVVDLMAKAGALEAAVYPRLV